MNKDIIRMAREAAFHVTGDRVMSPVIEGSDLLWLLERFADLVRADEREACVREAEVAISLLNDPVAAIRSRSSEH